MLTIKAMTGGETYAAHHLSNNDYYSVGETITGQWMGRGAELLGLEGAVTMEQFESIRLACDPSTGEYLRQRQSADRYGEVKRGDEVSIEKTATARNLYDFTVSAPKDLSIQALEDPRLIEAHKAGVAEMTEEMERLAGARVRKLGANDTRVTSNLVIARYDHDTSRELDPQLHTHLVAGNLTYDGTEEKWKALQASEIYAQRAYLTEVYRNAAARVVMSLGYQIEDRLEHGKDNGFGIVGIKEATREKYSQRSAQRDAAIAEFLDKNGRSPSNNEIARLVRDSRPEKLTEITTAEVKAGQRARMSPEEAATAKERYETALERGSIRETAPAAPSLAHAAEHIFERVSVAKDYELKTEALRHGRGRIELPEVKAELLTQVATGAMLTAHGEVATQETLQRERAMVQAINDGVGKYEPLGKGQRFVASDTLRPEQKTAVLQALQSRDFAFNISGAAGVGKTYALKELDRGLREARVSMTAVAPSARAVQVLQKDGLPNAMTIARLLADPNQQAQLAAQVLLIDEAGMVSSKDMRDLLKLAKDQNARIVYSGDTAQIKSVSEGDALRVLARESNLQTVSLREVRRQSNAEYRVAVEALRRDPTEGYKRFEKMGAIREVDWRLIGKETARAWREAAAVPNVKGEERSVLVVARTHDQIKSITYAIREERKAVGELGEGRNFEKHTALDWTEAQKKQMKRYQRGQVLTFHKAVKGVNKNESLEVINAVRDGVKARKSNGQDVTLTSKQAKAYGVFENDNLEVSAGDKLLLQANWREKGKNGFRATNGELVTVASVDDGSIKLQDGRQLPASYKQFTSGYAVTAHVGQGDTADFVIAAPDGMRRDIAYVTLTRGREGLTVVTSDAQALQETIGVSGDRQSATELARRAEAAARVPASRIAVEDYQLYQQFLQQQHERPAHQHRPEIQHEVTRNVRIDHNPGISIGF
jgi:conjugative relaxase-like TrwC/TraI family protein